MIMHQLYKLVNEKGGGAGGGSAGGERQQGEQLVEHWEEGALGV